MSNRFLRILLGLIFSILFVALGYLGYKYFSGTKGITTPVNTVPPIQTYEGTVSCLPIKPDDPYKDEDGCALGLKATNGFYYALMNVNLGSDSEGKNMRVRGRLDKSFVSHYQIEGRIQVEDYSLL